MTGALARKVRAVEIAHQLGIVEIFKGSRSGGEIDKHREAFEWRAGRAQLRCPHRRHTKRGLRLIAWKVTS